MPSEESNPVQKRRITGVTISPFIMAKLEGYTIGPDGKPTSEEPFDMGFHSIPVKDVRVDEESEECLIIAIPYVPGFKVYLAERNSDGDGKTTKRQII